MNLVKLETQQVSTTESDSDNESLTKYLTFHLGKELYAVNIMAVREIFEYGEVTPMPMMPDFICGSINLRGRAVPVVDLAKRMQQGAAEFAGRACFIIVEMHYGNEAMDVGVVVDAVNRVVDLKGSDIDRTPTFGGNIRVDFITGLGKIGEQFVTLLDMEKILSMDDLEIIATAEHADKEPDEVEADISDHDISDESE